MEENNSLNENINNTLENGTVTDSVNVTEESISVEEPKKKKKKKKLGRVISDVVMFLLFIVIVFEIVIGMINMQRISDEKDPVWYLGEPKVTETDLKNEVTYNLGLYKIVKTDTSKKTTVSLKPFFFGN